MVQQPSNEEQAPQGGPGANGGSHASDTADHSGTGSSLPPDDANWGRIYWITGLLGLAYIIFLGLFTLLFNTPAS